MRADGRDPRKGIALGICLALAVRLILMPVSLHGDLFYVHGMPPAIVFGHTWDLFRFFAPVGQEYGYVHYPPLVGYIVAFFEAAVAGVSVPFRDFILELPGLTLASGGDSCAGYFLKFPLFSRILFTFFMKLPYLVFDVACGVCIYAAFRTDRERGWLGLFLAWMFHPVLIYGVYIFGQHRIFSALFVWLAVLLRRKGRPVLASFTVGWILLLDNYGFLVLLPFLASVSSSIRSFLRCTAAALLPLVAFFVPLYFDSGGYVAYAYLSPQWVFQATLPVFPSIPYSGFVLKTLFAAIFFTVILRLFGAPASPEHRLRTLTLAWCAVLLAFYAATMTSVHYFLWILPFWLLLGREPLPWPRALNIALIFLLFLFNLDSRAQNLGLFTPVFPNAFSLPSAHDLMARWVPWGKIIGSSRMAFTILCFFMAWRLTSLLKPLAPKHR